MQANSVDLYRDLLLHRAQRPSRGDEPDELRDYLTSVLRAILLG
jgi:hypothetical protein